MDTPRIQSNTTALRLGRHQRTPNDSEYRSFLYPLRRTNYDYREPNNRFLESGPLDAFDPCGPPGLPINVSHWWTVEIAGFEIMNGPLLSLESDFFDAPEMAWQPDGPLSDSRAYATRHTHLKARLWWMNNTGRHRWADVDIGHGTRFSIQANQVFAGLLVPPGSLPITPGQKTVLPEPDPPAVITQAMIVGSINLSPWAPDAGQISTNTIVVDVLPGAATIPSGIGPPTPAIKIPPFAKRVQICQFGGAVTPLSFVPSVQRSAPDVWSIGLGPICPIVIDPATFSTQRIDIPQHASHIALGAPDFDDLRTYTFVFELDLR